MRNRIREILRKAERAFRDPSAADELRKEGVEVGETEEIDADRLLAELGIDSTDDEPSVLVTVFASEEDIARLRDSFEDALSRYVAEAGIGEWSGGGQGSIGDEAFFDVSFTVRDVASAIELIRAKVQELAPPGRVDIS